ncbi:MAG TPA: PAS domain-containing protein [Terriglobales bacterium]|nr:PAS domain-containing protein [Terriglobales bacterium]
MATHANRPPRYCRDNHALTTEAQPDDSAQDRLAGGDVDREEKQQKVNTGSWQWDITTDVTTWSEQLHRIAGRDPATVLPTFKEHSSFYTPESWELLTTATLCLLRTGEPYELELEIVRPDGGRRRVVGTGEAVRDSTGDILRLCGTVEDITERRWRIIADEQVLENPAHRATGYLIKANEEEKEEVAKELRDDICQRLCLLAADIQGLTSASTELPVQGCMRLEELWQETSEIVSEIVNLSHRLYPSTLDLLGLPLAIEGVCREFAARHSVSVECSCTGTIPEGLDKKIGLAFFRILEEVLGIIAKHNTGHVSVELINNAKELLLRVSDNRESGDSEEMESARGFAFIGAKERMYSVGGRLTAWSTPTGQARVEARAPLKVSQHSD